MAPQFGDMIDAFEVWPAVLDVAAHGTGHPWCRRRTRARDAEVVRLGADRLLTWLQPPVALRVLVEDVTYDVGPQGEAALVLRTDRFEAFRWRLGRRSRAQLANLDWTGDAAPVLDHLVVFGPAPSDIDE